MFENTIAHKRILKKKALLDALAQASEEGNDWKVRQLEGKIACFDRKYYPKVFWDSSKGTYRKPKKKGICNMDIKDLTSWGLTEVMFNVIENGFYADEETGEVFFTSDDLDALEEKLDDKLNGICGYIKRSEASAEMLKNRKKEIENSIKFYENRADRLSEFLKSLMSANNIDKKELKDYRLGTRKTSSVNIIDEDAVYKFLDEHPEYNETCKKVETKTSLVKKGLKEVLANENVPGAQIVEGKSISIK